VFATTTNQLYVAHILQKMTVQLLGRTYVVSSLEEIYSRHSELLLFPLLVVLAGARQLSRRVLALQLGIWDGLHQKDGEEKNAPIGPAHLHYTCTV
jgi:hypothetical protein